MLNPPTSLFGIDLPPFPFPPFSALFVKILIPHSDVIAIEISIIQWCAYPSLTILNIFIAITTSTITITITITITTTSTTITTMLQRQHLPFRDHGISQDPSSLFSPKVVFYLVLWYSTSSLTSQLTKKILTDFDFPVLVGEVQFSANFILGLLTLTACRHSSLLRNFFPKHTLPKSGKFLLSKSYFKIFLPMGSFQFVGKLFSLAATSISTVATVSSIRALSPLFIVLGYRLHWKTAFPSKVYISLIPLLLGVIIIVVSQSTPNLPSSTTVTVYKDHINQIDKINQLNTNHHVMVSDDSSLSNPETDFENYRILSIISSILSNNSLQFQGVFYALLSTAVFAAGSIYAKSVISVKPAPHHHLPEPPQTLGLNHSYSPKDKTRPPSLLLSATESCSNLSFLDIEKNQPTPSEKHNYNNQHTPKVDKLTTLMYCSLYGLAYSVPTFLTYEFPTLLSSKFYPSPENLESIPIPYYSLIPWKLLLINSISYFTQSLLAFHLLGMLPTVTYSIANMMKRIIVIAVSIAFKGKSPTFLEWLGLLHVSLGLYIYEKMGRSKR